MMDKHYEIATDLLEDVWVHIDFDKITRGRLRGIRDEFANKTKALSRCYSGLGAFLDRMCRSFDSRIAREKTKSHLDNCDQEKIMQIFRTEAQIPVLLLQLRRDEQKKKYEKQIQKTTEQQKIFNS